MGDRAIGPLAALLVTAVVLLGVGLYLRTMYASVHTLLELRQPGPTLPHLPPCEWTLGELEVLADQRQLAIEVVSHDETHRFGPSIPGETSRRMRVSSLQRRDRCVQVLLTIWGSG
jgi:hypothetical protein